MFETASIVVSHPDPSSSGPVAVLPLAALVALVDDPLGPSWAIDGGGHLLMRNDGASLLLGDPAARTQLDRAAAEALSTGRSTQAQVTIGGEPRRYFVVRARVIGVDDGRRAVWFQAVETTVKDQLIEALRESRAMFKSLTEAVGDFAWVVDAEGRFAYVSGGVPSAGLAAWDLTGRRVSDLGEEAAACFLARSPMPLRDVNIRTPLGRTVCLSVAAVPIMNGAQWVGARGIARNVTEERRAERMLEEARKRDRLLRQVLDGIHTGTDPAAMLENASRVTRAAFEADVCRIRYEQETVEDVNPARSRQGSVQRLRADCRFQGEKVGVLEVERRSAGWGREDSVLLGQVAAHVAMAIAQANHLRALERLARTDGLTGLLNRRAFEEVMAHRLGGLGEGGGVLMLIDLDHFKQLNDTGGHAAGDTALCEVAQLLRKLSGPQDVVARFGGDEFVLWLEGASLSGGRRRRAP
ncbi:sensor domain-containing diguanylate cyclase [Pedomonas mirosovicensis]|uniref:sensor domain-containing diguanylate cyclase n=1 Tax=Pedomonas mirosovicensis TaxID=2908641 RepID=UPI00216A1250|nr:sensor domain-containing diguanylate cyclase [Pedomonas mirosovicensis]MCH8684208.1 sensor domain-containing diguanylate cyclase [Pedomonas mirosovicensis]